MTFKSILLRLLDTRGLRHVYLFKFGLPNAARG